MAAPNSPLPPNPPAPPPIDPRIAAQETAATGATGAREGRPTRDAMRPGRSDIARESRERYVASDRLEGMYHIPANIIPLELEPRWVRLMRTQTIPDEENYQRAISEGYVELNTREFPKIRRMRMIRPIPGFEDCEIRGGLLLMVRDRLIGKKERENRKKRITQQMRGIRDWVQDNPEESAHRIINPNFQRSDLGTRESVGIEQETGPAAGMFQE